MNKAKRDTYKLKELKEGLIRLVAAGNGSGNNPIPKSTNTISTEKVKKVFGGNGSGNNPIGTQAAYGAYVYPVTEKPTVKP
ncbi:hypothetical protein [Pseudoalteromonas sp. S16_S37]|uniref:hypothetical protein n=1 Tax=Pseudoalteromonas sp. S16_S37 TaxID=2720228 RepID=UPI0016807E5E|nr:hypothetical protein [Pseudoalteromonas sp. S16_S37]MBD1584886.1 hypothetical protein [Pseudoalteromonas sp. S16_S37]